MKAEFRLQPPLPADIWWHRFWVGFTVSFLALAIVAFVWAFV